MRISDWSSDVCSSDLVGRGYAPDASSPVSWCRRFRWCWLECRHPEGSRCVGGVAPTYGTWRFRGSAPGRSSGLRSVAQQAPGRGARFRAHFDAAEHARQLFLALPGIEPLHGALGDAVAGGLADPVVRVALRGDLRRVGTAQHRPRIAQRPQLLADDPGGGAADARIDLVA